MYILQIDLGILIPFLIFIFLLIPYTILTFVVIWVYRDAKKNQINAAVWVIIVWITPFFIGFIKYMSFRKRQVSND
ncbi:MAG: hypothetical protein ACFE9S_02560 [Candidatus Hermodarchaeota archaeon]